MNDEPDVREMAALWKVCMKFIEAQQIGCPETIYQTDRVIEHAYELIEDVCNVVGYVPDEDEE